MIRLLLSFTFLTTIVSAGTVTQGVFRLNTNQQSYFTSSISGQTMAYGPSSLSNMAYTSASTVSTLKATVGVDGDVESNSYFSLINHDIGNNTDSAPLYRNPAASITAGYFDLLNKNDVVSGTFKHQMTYQIDGVRSATAADIYVTLTVYVQQCLFGVPGSGVCSVISSDARTWGPGDAMPSSTILTVEAPYSQDYFLYQELLLQVAVPDQIQTSYFNGPPQAPVFSNVHAGAFSFSATADFAHTATLTNMALLDAGNSLLANQSFNSGNGDSYPQGDAAVPEPATSALMIGGLGFATILARRKVRN